ncbi:T9SS type A sorting domain-containing protein [bacterium]|nr:T9SS type A sorting domain-containing protein [bacterium]
MNRMLLLCLLVSSISSSSIANWRPGGIRFEMGLRQSPSVVADEEGGAWMFYTGTTGVEGGSAAFFQHVSSSGEIQFRGAGVRISDASVANAAPVAMFPRENGNILFLYWQWNDPQNSRFLATICNSQGIPVVNSPTILHRSSLPAVNNFNQQQLVCLDDSGGAWCLVTSDNGDSLFVVGVNRNGTPKSIPQPLVSSSISGRTQFAIARSDVGDAWITWRDSTAGMLYLQNIGLDGEMGDEPVVIGQVEQCEDLHISVRWSNWVNIWLLDQPGRRYYTKGSQGNIDSYLDSANMAEGWHVPQISNQPFDLIGRSLNANTITTSSYGFGWWHDSLNVINTPLFTSSELTSQSIEVAFNSDSAYVILERTRTHLPEPEYLYTAYRFEFVYDGFVDTWEMNNPVFAIENLSVDPGVPWSWVLSDGGVLVAFNQVRNVVDRDILLYHINSNGYISGQTSVEETSIQPDQFQLYPAWPNPFNGSTRLTYTLPAAGEVRFSVYDLLGREVALLEQGQRTAGQHSLLWNSDSPLAGSVASGVYFVQLKTAAGLQTRRVVLLK